MSSIRNKGLDINFMMLINFILLSFSIIYQPFSVNLYFLVFSLFVYVNEFFLVVVPEGLVSLRYQEPDSVSACLSRPGRVEKCKEDLPVNQV